MTVPWFPELSFASPEYFFAWMAIPMLWVIKAWADRRSHRISERLISSPRLRKNLVSGDHRSRAWIQFLLQTFALLLWIAAAAQPRYGSVREESFSKGRNILIAIDTSKSMLATDMAPNRLMRSKLAAQDLLLRLAGDRVGLIAFAGSSFLQAPLTEDHYAVQETINTLDYYTIPKGGSSLAAAIQLAEETFKETKSDMNGLIIFSDGQETDDGALAAAEKAGKIMRIVTLGIGSEEGELLINPDSEGGNDYIRDGQGRVVQSRLESEVLRSVAQATQGRYIPLTTNAALATAVDQALSSLGESQNTTKEIEKPIERYQWPLALGILLMLISLLIRAKKRPLTSAMNARALSPAKATLPAIIIAGLWLSQAPSNAASQALTQGNDAFQKEHYPEALKNYDAHLEQAPNAGNRPAIQYGNGAAQYYQKNYTDAIKRFSDGLLQEDPRAQAHAFQGIGSSLYYLGIQELEKHPKKTIAMLKESLEHYRSAIQRSDNPALVENRDFIQSILKAIEEAEQKKEEEKQKQQKQENGEKGEDQEEGEGDQSDPQDSEGKPEKGSDESEEGKESDGKTDDAGMREEEQNQVPDGELRAGEEGEADDKQGQAGAQAQEQVDEETGFSPTDARNQLKNYSDDQKTIQYMQRRERPAHGKDF